VAEDLVPLALVDIHHQTIFRLRHGTLLIGRSSECGLILASEAVSRRHAELEVSGSTVHVRDLGSRNGTFINDEPVAESAVSIGDRLKFGLPTFLLQHVDDMRQIEEPETRRHREEGGPPAGVLAPNGPHEKLSDAQRRVFDRLIQGKSEKEVASELHLSQNTVHTHVQKIYEVFEVHTRAMLIARALRRD
jgi:pSer/pThr/pTyr-binding forkhead associated (FHA) protein